MALKRPYSDEWHDFSEDTMTGRAIRLLSQEPISRRPTTVDINSRNASATPSEGCSRSLATSWTPQCQDHRELDYLRHEHFYCSTPSCRPSPSFVDPAIILRLLARPPSNPAQVRGVLLEDNIGRDRFTVDISKFKTLEKSTRSSVATINDENTPPTIKAKTSLSSLFSIN
ncbi:hypothetical protein CPB85DRAFT_1254771 [Mucidula mucida]|nr:hypothetical protein CPB85DRAFT_1254771 [Mucidula mucida]